jgi:GntR family transcriptional regulator
VSPERQMEDPEVTFRNESDRDIRVEREIQQVPATDELAEAFGLPSGEEITRVVTRAVEDSRPISISDTFQPLDIVNTSEAALLEETVADRLPSPTHAVWLRTTPGDLVKQIHQRFFTADSRLIMMSDVSYPRDRYDAFMFRMTLSPDTATTNGK